MNEAVLNSELIATKAGILPFIIMMVRRRNIFQHQQNILLSVSVSRHVLV